MKLGCVHGDLASMFLNGELKLLETHSEFVVGVSDICYNNDEYYLKLKK